MAGRPARFFVGPQRISGEFGATVSGKAAKDVRQQFREIENNFADFINALKDVTPEAIEFGLQPIFDKSQLYVPVKTGRLKRSGFIEAEKTVSGAIGRVGYGKGNDPPYALIVHENTEMFHKPPTSARFLMRAVEEHFFTVLNRITSFLAENTGLR
jgi:hypothetical protein